MPIFLRQSASLIAVLITTLIAAQTFAETILKIESWRTQDKEVWDEQIIPIFEAQHPDIQIEFLPIEATKYDSALNQRLSDGVAGDIITCRPFQVSLEMFRKGQLANITDLEGLKNFSAEAKSTWSTKNGGGHFCVPIASVIHGFIYNKDIFDELNLKVPTTNDEFFLVLEKIKSDEKYLPLAMGTADKWEAATVGYNNIGVNYWKGDDGRAKLFWGEAKFTDSEFTAPLETLKQWSEFMGKGFQSRSYKDSQNLFIEGKAAIYPSGSWEIGGFNNSADFTLGAFPPPIPNADDDCFITDHMDIGIGLNAASQNKNAARLFLNWVASFEFANLYTNALPGYYSLSNFSVKNDDSLAKEFISWRKKCRSSIRLTTQLLRQYDPKLESQLWSGSAAVINGLMTPEEAAKSLQVELERVHHLGE